MILFTALFWRTLGWSLARTALATTTPFLAPFLADPSSTLGPWMLAVAGTLLLQIATSLGGIPTTDGATWWQVLISRALRQAGQAAIPILTATALIDLDWSVFGQRVGIATLTTLVLTALVLLPESETPVKIEGDVGKVTGDVSVSSDQAVLVSSAGQLATVTTGASTRFTPTTSDDTTTP